MNSATLPSFWEKYHILSRNTKSQIMKAHRLWSENPFHPSLRFKCINQPENVFFLRSADIYRKLRKIGITIRKPLDCMIASVAIENDIPLLHNDKDFQPIEKHCGLKVPSLT